MIRFLPFNETGIILISILVFLIPLWIFAFFWDFFITAILYAILFIILIFFLKAYGLSRDDQRRKLEAVSNNLINMYNLGMITSEEYEKYRNRFLKLEKQMEVK